MAIKITFEISFSESSLSVLSKIYIQLKAENTKTTEKLHLKHAVNHFVNMLPFLPCKALDVNY
jgi:hypothetical protein